MALAVNSLGGRQRSPSRHSSRSTPDAEEFNVSRDSDLFNFNECLEKGIPSRLCIEVTGSNSEIPKDAHVHYNGELEGVEGALAGGRYDLHLVDLSNRPDQSFSGNSHWSKALRTPRELRRRTSEQVNSSASGRWKDPLPDELFALSHHRKEMEERKFSVADRTKMLTEFDECMNTMARLGRDVKLKARLSLEEQFRRILRFPLDNRELTRLASILPSITRITDPGDSSEIAVKYRLTVKELMRFILKFEQGKMRELELKRKKVKSEVDTDEEEGKDPINMADVIKLRHKRLLRRNRKYGKIIKVHFYQGITLVIDPVSKARIETKR